MLEVKRRGSLDGLPLEVRRSESKAGAKAPEVFEDVVHRAKARCFHRFEAGTGSLDRKDLLGDAVLC